MLRATACLYKIPQSVLVVIYTATGQVLLLQRTQGDGLGGVYLAVGDGQQGGAGRSVAEDGCPRGVGGDGY